ILDADADPTLARLVVAHARVQEGGAADPRRRSEIRIGDPALAGRKALPEGDQRARERRLHGNLLRERALTPEMSVVPGRWSLLGACAAVVAAPVGHAGRDAHV